MPGAGTSLPVAYSCQPYCRLEKALAGELPAAEILGIHNDAGDHGGYAGVGSPRQEESKSNVYGRLRARPGTDRPVCPPVRKGRLCVPFLTSWALYPFIYNKNAPLLDNIQGR